MSPILTIKFSRVVIFLAPIFCSIVWFSQGFLLDLTTYYYPARLTHCWMRRKMQQQKHHRPQCTTNTFSSTNRVFLFAGQSPWQEDDQRCLKSHVGDRNKQNNNYQSSSAPRRKHNPAIQINKQMVGLG